MRNLLILLTSMLVMLIGCSAAENSVNTSSNEENEEAKSEVKESETETPEESSSEPESDDKDTEATDSTGSGEKSEEETEDSKSKSQNTQDSSENEDSEESSEKETKDSKTLTSKEQVKSELTYGGTGEGDEIKSVTFDNGKIEAVINLADDDILTPTLNAINSYSQASDYLLKFEGWDVLTIEYTNVGEVSFNRNQAETNEYGGEYFPSLKIEEQLK
ncbi:hypothetical protein [Halobacillus salinus]|uniref:hypothetical protein n=1 Tax=Halobacillus salinus TaxID=192814 RepID=UPI0009A5DFAF|nr:hypothetical protein [Halobacillus salinus]